MNLTDKCEQLRKELGDSNNGRNWLADIVTAYSENVSFLTEMRANTHTS